MSCQIIWERSLTNFVICFGDLLFLDCSRFSEPPECLRLHSQLWFDNLIRACRACIFLSTGPSNRILILVIFLFNVILYAFCRQSCNRRQLLGKIFVLQRLTLRYKAPINQLSWMGLLPSKHNYISTFFFFTILYPLYIFIYRFCPLSRSIGNITLLYP